MPSGYTEDDADCDDNDAAVHPDDTEICYEIDEFGSVPKLVFNYLQLLQESFKALA